MTLNKIIAVFCVITGSASCADVITHEMVTLDSALPAYQPAGEFSGKVTVISRDRLEKVATRWLDRFHGAHVGVNGVDQADGQGNTLDTKWDDTVPYSLLPVAGGGKCVVQKRKALPEEIDEFTAKTGHAPTEIMVARFSCNSSGLHTYWVIVHKDNPLAKLTLAQVDAIFSKERFRGAPERIMTWRQLGVTDKALADKPLHLYGRIPGFPAYDFRQVALKFGQFNDGYYGLPDLEVVTAAVGADKKGIGFTDSPEHAGVKKIAISVDENSPAYIGTLSDMVERKYPLMRTIFIYADIDPATPADPMLQDFLRMVVSKEGQEDLWAEGMLPLNAAEAKAAATIIK